MEKHSFLPLETMGGLFQIAKGQDYYRGFSQYLNNKKNQPLWDLFNYKKHQISDALVSFRTLNHWEKEGIIPNLKKDGGWRKFSLMDILWLLTVKELRSFGIGLKKIKSIKKSLISRHDHIEYGDLEFYSALALLDRTPVNILVFQNFKSEIGTAYEIIESSDKFGLLSHLSINLNYLLQTVFPKMDLKPIFRNFIEISQSDEQIFNTFKIENLEEVIVKFKQGNPELLQYTLREETSSNIGQLKGKNAYQEITVSEHGGKITGIKRKISKKIK